MPPKGYQRYVRARELGKKTVNVYRRTINKAAIKKDQNFYLRKFTEAIYTHGEDHRFTRALGNKFLQLSNELKRYE